MNSFRQLIYKRIIPLTIISFVLITKWWYVLPTDAPHSIMIGFPFAYSCNGWHTSLSEQFFVLEFIFDFLVYFVFWAILIFLINQFLVKIIPKKLITIILLSISGILIVLSTFFVLNPTNVFLLKRNFEIEVIETHYKFIWKHIDRPNQN